MVETPSTLVGALGLAAGEALADGALAISAALGEAAGVAIALAEAAAGPGVAIALAEAAAGPAVAAIGAIRAGGPTVGPMPATAPAPIATATTSAAIASGIGTNAPRRGSRSRQFGQKPETGVVTNPQARQRTGRRARGMRQTCAFAVRSRFRALSGGRSPPATPVRGPTPIAGVAASLEEPSRELFVLDPRRIELSLAAHDDRDAKRVPLEEDRIAGDVDPLDLERDVQRDAPQRTVGLGAEAAVRLLEQPDRPRRRAMGAPPHERQGAPQIAAHYAGAAITSCRSSAAAAPMPDG